MDKQKNVWVVGTACLFVLLSSCSGPSVVKSEDGPVQIAFINFEDEKELDNWNLSSDFGHTELSQDIKFSGVRAIHFSPDSGCYVVDRKTGIEVQRGKNYSLSFNAIVKRTKIGERSYCVGDLTIIVKQGNEEILYQSVFDAPTWERKTYYFEARNNLPVNIKLIIGNDVWIDDINMVQEIQ